MYFLTFIRKLLATVLSAFVAVSTSVQADDTDIYLHNPHIDKTIKPNVIFMLDNSNSMSSSVQGSKDSRLSVMQETFSDILQSTEGVNVGLMFMHEDNKLTGRLTHPISDLDALMDPWVMAQGTPVIANGLDNGYEDLKTDRVYLSPPQLPLGSYTSGSTGNNHLTALRFQNVGIPQGATITKASIEFVAKESSNDAVEFVVKAGLPEVSDKDLFIEEGANLAFQEENKNLSDRLKNAFTTPELWVPGEWIGSEGTTHNSYFVDVSKLMEKVVSSEEWCGNNAATFYFQPTDDSLGNRIAHSYDSHPAFQPKLRIEFTGGENGCKNEWVNTRIKSKSHDAYEESPSYKIKDRSNTLYLGKINNKVSSTHIGLYYPNIPIHKDAQILSATLELTSAIDNSNGAEFTIGIEQSTNAPAINTSNKKNLSSRQTIDTQNSWEEDNWKKDQTYAKNIKDLITKSISRSDWKAGNNLMLLLEHESGKSGFYGYDGNATFSPRLSIKVASGGIVDDGEYTARDFMIEKVNAISLSGKTPITSTYYDAANYLQNGWKNEYSSPIINECQSNYAIMLTDGMAYSDYSSQGKIKEFINLDGECVVPPTHDGDPEKNVKSEVCSRELANWLHNNDLKNNLNGQQKVTTHTIAFALQKKQGVVFMKDMAAEGGGKFYNADNAQELASAFQNIITGILEDEATFVSPGVTANQFNNSRHLSQLYYSVFKPSKTDRWQGNLKRYRMMSPDGLESTTGIYDANDELAVDSETGFFLDSAISYWSDQVDGRTVTLGGAGGKLPEERNLITYLDDNPAGKPIDLSQGKYALTHRNLSLDDLNVDSEERETEVLNWIKDRNTWYGDPLHSIPGLVTYRCNVEQYPCPEFKETVGVDGITERSDAQELGIFFGTNDGFFHGIDATTGAERFGFIPKELLPNLDKLYQNNDTSRVTGTGRPYGMDGSVTLWINDANHNGVLYGGYNPDNASTPFLPNNQLNPGEFAYAYIGMRRGGDAYYAFDVSDIDAPELIWTINSNSSGFGHLGQTWSKPVKTKIQIRGAVRDVLVFAGGYDHTQDTATEYQQDSVGNAVFIVDAKTGERIWSAGNDSSHNLLLTNMNYSIPGAVRVIDINGDELADQMFFADTGGQLWRLFINNCTATDTSDCVNNIADLVWPTDSNGNGSWDSSEGILASIGTTSKQETSKDSRTKNARRFFVEPDVSLFRLNGATHMAIAIGSGNRPDPLGRVNWTIKDRMYLFVVSNYQNPTVDPSYRLLRNVDKHAVITEAGMKDITNSVGITADGLQGIFGNDTKLDKQGWYLTLEPKEKVMSDAVTFENVLYFNTYQPSSEIVSHCNPSAGIARAYGVDLLTGNPVTTDDLNNPDKSDRYSNLANAGIPPTPSILFPEGSKDALVCVGAECDPLEIGDDKQTTYWRQVR